jgi:hypothetical protein
MGETATAHIAKTSIKTLPTQLGKHFHFSAKSPTIKAVLPYESLHLLGH